jgi:hypothetical protein
MTNDKGEPIYTTIFHASDSSYYLESLNYSEDSGKKANSGLRIDLNRGSIKSPKFNIDSNGNATFSGNLKAAGGTFSGRLKGVDGDFEGKITATSGSIGGWTI